MNNSDEIKNLPYDLSYITEQEKKLINELFPGPQNKFIYKIFSSVTIVIVAIIIYSEQTKIFLSNFFPKEILIFIISLFFFIFINCVRWFEGKEF